MSLLDKASLIVTPNGYSENTIYSVIPSSGAGDLTFTRATDAWRTNSQGLIQGTPWNLFRYSEDFSNGNWSKGSSTISTNTALAPNGTLTADSFVSAGSGSCFFSQYFNIVSRTCTISIHVKYVDRQFIQILYGSVFSSDYANFDIKNGLITAGVNSSSSISNVGNGWFRISMTTTGGINLPESYIWAIDSGTSARASTSSGVGSYYVWGAQAVESSSALQYFPTTDRQDVPRIDYSLGGCPTLLMEPQRTNLQLNSEDFSTYGQVSVTTTVNQTAAPTGLSTADLIAETAVTSGHSVFNNFACSVTSGTTYTLSCYLKKGPGATAPDIIQLSSPQGFTSLYANYNITTGVVTQSSGVVSTSITSVGNGWWRCSLTATASSIALFSGLAIVLVNNNPTSGASPSYLGQVTSNVYAWGGQVEAGAYPTSYIPTTTASVTRNADVASKTGITSLIGQTEGTLFIDFIFKTPEFIAGGQAAVASSSVSIYDRVIIWNNSTTNTLAALVQANNVLIYNVSLGSFIDGARYRIAIAYKSGDSIFYVNGVQVGSSSASFSFSAALNTFILGSYELTSLVGHQRNNSSILFKNRLSSSELELLTGDSFDSYAKMAAYFNYTLQ